MGVLSVENIVKLVTALGTASLIIGITYNIAFFAGSKVHWLFYISIADNITATMYALPFTLIFAAFFLFYALSAYRARLDTKRVLLIAINVLASVAVALFLGYLSRLLLPAEWSIPPLGSSFLEVLAVLGVFGVIVTAGALSGAYVGTLRASGEVRPASAVKAGLLLIGAMLLGPIFVAGLARQSIAKKPSYLYVETPQKMVISGSVVRMLDSGIILAKGEDWLWIPRSEIKLIVEQKR